jgi:hypothetical protein
MSQSLKRLAWRLDRDALFAELGYEPHPGQLLVHRSKARFRVLACGTRWGKSTCAGMEAVAAMLEPSERTIGWLVAPTYDVCRRIYTHLCAAITQKIGHRVIELSPREQKIVIVNMAGGASELRCKSADHPVGLLGESLDFLIVDEAATMRDEIWEGHLAPRLIDRKGRALVISTPQSKGWFYSMYLRGRKKLDPECESWASPSRDNPHVSAEVIEAERGRMPADKFAQQYEAEFLGVYKEPCRICGGPQENVTGRVTAPVGEYEDDFVPTCPKCGMFVDANGRCIVSKHNEWICDFEIDRPWADPTSGTCFNWYTAAADGRWIQ